MKTKDFYLAQELADKLQVNVMTIYRYIKAKKLKAYKIGKEFRIDNAEFERFLIVANKIMQPDRVKHMFLEAGFSRELRTVLVLVEKPENFKNYIIVIRRVVIELERGRSISLSINNRVLYSNNRIDQEVAPEVRVVALGVKNNSLRAKRVTKDILEARKAKGLYL